MIWKDKCVLSLKEMTVVKNGIVTHNFCVIRDLAKYKRGRAEKEKDP